jgi:hypothetical protein
MTLKRTLLIGAILLVAGITLLHVFVNQGGGLFGKTQEEAGEKFRVGFLPVT